VFFFIRPWKEEEKGLNKHGCRENAPDPQSGTSLSLIFFRGSRMEMKRYSHRTCLRWHNKPKNEFENKRGCHLG
jgi:hypothetical protein